MFLFSDYVICSFEIPNSDGSVTFDMRKFGISAYSSEQKILISNSLLLCVFVSFYKSYLLKQVKNDQQSAVSFTIDHMFQLTLCTLCSHYLHK